MRRWWLWVGQGVLVVAVAWFVGRAIVGRWEEFTSLELALDLRVGPVALAAVTVWLTYAILIEAWRRILRGWAQRLPYGSAARIWCLSNLGRYLPGKVWGIAGLAVLAHRAGVSGWTAAGSALTMQALAVGTGASVVAAAAPGAVSPLQLAAAGFIALAAAALLVWERGARQLVGLVRPGTELHALPASTAALAAAATLASWVSYGVAFWLLAEGLVPDSGMSLRPAIGVFAAGYLVGLLALFAPGGVGVRELVFVAMLTPEMGSGGAVAVTVASRLLLTITEATAALAVAAFGGRPKENAIDAT